MKMNNGFMALMAFLLGTPLLLNAVTTDSPDRKLSVKGDLHLQTPVELRHLLIDDPRVAVLVEVDESGDLKDWMPFSATHFKLIPSAIKAVQNATFEPALEDGKPVLSRGKVHVTFYDPEQRIWKDGGGMLPMGSNVSEGAERRIYQVSAASFRYGETPAKDLDAPLSIKHATVQVLRNPDGSKPSGSVVVEYFIGPDGKAHFPKVLSSDDPILGMSALLTLQSTEFQPPLKNDRPTWVRARQPFNFSGKENP